MRWFAVAALAIFGCGSGSNPPGTLICAASPQPGSIDVRIAVPENGLAATRDRARSVAKLTDCRFEAGTADPRPESLVRGRDRTADPIDPIDPPPARPSLPIDPPPPPPPPDDDDDQGVVGTLTGSDDPWGAPAPPQPPRNVPPTLLEANRISGTKLIEPDDSTKKAIQQDGKTRLIGSFKLCLSAAGIPTQVTQLKSTGYPAYDTKIQTQMRDWRYRPYLSSGDPIPVCTAVTFIYTQP